MERLLRVEEAAEALAIRPSTVRAWILARRLATVKVGERAVRIPEGAVLRIIEEGTRPARKVMRR